MMLTPEVPRDPRKDVRVGTGSVQEIALVTQEVAAEITGLLGRELALGRQRFSIGLFGREPYEIVQTVPGRLDARNSAFVKRLLATVGGETLFSLNYSVRRDDSVIEEGVVTRVGSNSRIIERTLGVDVDGEFVPDSTTLELELNSGSHLLSRLA